MSREEKNHKLGIGNGRQGRGHHLYPHLPQTDILTPGNDQYFSELMQGVQSLELTEKQKILYMLTAFALVAPMALAAIPGPDTHSVSTFHPDNRHNLGNTHISMDDPGLALSDNPILDTKHHGHDRHQSESSVKPAKKLDVFGSVGLLTLRKILAERITDVAQQTGDLCATNPEALCFVDTNPEGHSILFVQIPETEGARAEINVLGITELLRERGLIPDNYSGDLEFDMFGPYAGCSYTGGWCTRPASSNFPDKRSYSLETDTLGNQWVLFNNGGLKIPLADFVQAINKNVFYASTLPQTPLETPIVQDDPNLIIQPSTETLVPDQSQTTVDNTSVLLTHEERQQMTKQVIRDIVTSLCIAGLCVISIPIVLASLGAVFKPKEKEGEEKKESKKN